MTNGGGMHLQDVQGDASAWVRFRAVGPKIAHRAGTAIRSEVPITNGGGCKAIVFQEAACSILFFLDHKASAIKTLRKLVGCVHTQKTDPMRTYVDNQELTNKTYAAIKWVPFS